MKSLVAVLAISILTGCSSAVSVHTYNELEVGMDGDVALYKMGSKTDNCTLISRYTIQNWSLAKVSCQVSDGSDAMMIIDMKGNKLIQVDKSWKRYEDNLRAWSAAVTSVSANVNASLQRPADPTPQYQPVSFAPATYSAPAPSYQSPQIYAPQQNYDSTNYYENSGSAFGQ